MKKWSPSLVASGLMVMALSCWPTMAFAEPNAQINDQGVVVWQAGTNGHRQIWRWDPKTGMAQEISDPTYDNDLFKINAKGVVVWTAYDVAHSHIFRWDPKTATPEKISNPNVDNQAPQINAKGLVTWEGYSFTGGIYSVWLYNPKTKQTTQISP